MKTTPKMFLLAAASLAAATQSDTLKASCDSPTFASPYSYVTGSNPKDIAAADFNEDGIVDLVVANSQTSSSIPGSISIYLGTGGGAFGPAVEIGVQREPFIPVVGDFNGDGHVDIAVNNGWSDSVSVLIGHGDGTFAVPVHYPAGSHPQSIATADFNGDGIADLVVGEAFGNSVGVLLGNGNGTFQAPIHSASGGYPTTLAIGDFNGDGDLDLAVANLYANTVSVLLGLGNGAFSPPTPYPAGNHTYFVATGDLNGDGRLDLVVTQQFGDRVSVFLGHGDGTFSAMVDYPVGDFPSEPVIADFNGDGKADVAISMSWESVIAILPGDGSGGLGAPIKIPAGVNHHGTIAADLNGDGKIDIAATDQVGNALWILLNACNTAPTVVCQDAATIDCAPPSGATTTVSAVITDPDSDTITVTLKEGATVLGTTHVSGPASSATVSFNVSLGGGAHALTFEVSDGHESTSCDTAVTVNVDQAGPTLSVLTPSTSELWPPNHKLVLVEIQYTAHDDCGIASTTLTAHSNEPDNGLGDGDTSNDIQLIPGDSRHVYLRAERSGKGSGRVYTIRIDCADIHGNTTTAYAEVSVPKSKK